MSVNAGWPALLGRARAVLAFAFVPGLSMLSTLVVLPLVAHLLGEDGWIPLSVGQSLGALASVAVGLAWPVVGANMVAYREPQFRHETVRRSLSSRAIVFCVTTPAIVLISGALVPTDRFNAGLFAVGATLNGFTFGWFYSGTDQPRRLLINEALVRLLSNLLSVPLLAITQSLTAYATVCVLAGVLMLCMNVRTTLPRGTRWMWSWRSGSRDLLAQAPMAVSRACMAAGNYLASSMVAGVNRGILGDFSALDRLHKSGTNACDALPAGMASWVGGAERGSQLAARRTRLALWISIGFAMTVAVLWVAAGPFVVKVLFAGKVAIDAWTLMLSACCIALPALFNALSILVMVPLARTREITLWSYVNAVVTVLGVVGGARFAGLNGALAGVAAGPLVGCAAYCAIFCAGRPGGGRRRRGRHRRRRNGATAARENR